MANTEKLDKLAPRGQENTSLIQQYSPNSRAALASTKFTFTCASQVPGTVQWPSQSPAQAQPASYSHVLADAPSRQSISGQTVASSANTSNTTTQDFPPIKSAGSKTGRSRRKARRRLDQELNIAARHRRQIAAETFYHHPPKIEDLWICEFCEYERIFGEPPRALIREYELKDRRHRQEEADRRRLLEKAKAKSRKGKKSGKPSGKASNAAHQSPDQCPSEAPTTHDAPLMLHDQSQSTQSDGERREEDFQTSQTSTQSSHLPDDGDGGGKSTVDVLGA
ncbi:hypothetical protein CDD82_5677 [Ophiocordyceps australis]|uniref:Uncharacterized protein n=1 Tax=Ophiocordyceps australis TaxID=1399860 RepID=A0A2C5YZU2_9HYPO|nr:hypothetical protein CDD82_5677 [Ophiocordyceps australis]